MARYVTRIIEYKEKDKWKILTWFTPYIKTEPKESEYDKPDVTNPPLTKHHYFCDNACVYRECLIYSDYATDGFPSDMSEEAKEIANLYKTDNGWLSSNHYHLTLKELYLWAEHEKDKLFNEINQKNFDKGLSFALSKLGQKSKKDDDEEDPYDSVAYLESEAFNEYLSIQSEADNIRLLTDIVTQQYYDSSDIRVIYYYT